MFRFPVSVVVSLLISHYLRSEMLPVFGLNCAHSIYKATAQSTIVYVRLDIPDTTLRNIECIYFIYIFCVCVAMELTKRYLPSFIAPLLVGQTCCEQPSPPPPEDRLQAQVEGLRRDFVAYIMTGAEPDSDQGRLVADMVDGVRSEHGKVLELCHRSPDLDLRPENAEVISQTIARECLESPASCNWGRVAAVLAFSRLVARRMGGADERHDRFLENYSVSMADFLARFILEWRSEVGEGVSTQMRSTDID